MIIVLLFLNHYGLITKTILLNNPLHFLLCFNFSRQYFGFSLCIRYQDLLKPKFEITSRQSIKLYFSLRKRGVPAELEKFDGYKTINIAVEEAKVNIEVDGKHYHYNTGQGLTDLQGTFYSFQKGY